MGGAMTVENPFVAKARLHTLRRYLPVSQTHLPEGQKEFIPQSYFFEKLPTYLPILRLSENFAESLRMMSEIQKLCEDLPGIDCGACGAPTCHAFAEDVICGRANDGGCVLKRKQQLEEMLSKEESEHEGQ